MAEDLQGLLNKIQTEGLQKAEAEKNRIIQDAQAQAEKLVADAQAQADTIRKKAEEDAKASEEKARVTIQQAARDILIALKADLLKRLREVVKECSCEAMKPEVMADLVIQMAKAFASKGDEGVEILLASKNFDKVSEQLKGSLLKNLKSSPVISVGQNFSGGLQIGFKGQDVFLDFSDEALADVICDFVGPKIAAAIKD